MKLKDLTKEQRASIEADELGNYIIFYLGDRENLKISVKNIIEAKNKQEIKRTIKRINDEIEFMVQNVTYYDDYKRFDILKKQKQLYELMEQLE